MLDVQILCKIRGSFQILFLASRKASWESSRVNSVFSSARKRLLARVDGRKDSSSGRLYSCVGIRCSQRKEEEKDDGDR